MPHRRCFIFIALLVLALLACDRADDAPRLDRAPAPPGAPAAPAAPAALAASPPSSDLADGVDAPTQPERASLVMLTYALETDAPLTPDQLEATRDALRDRIDALGQDALHEASVRVEGQGFRVELIMGEGADLAKLTETRPPLTMRLLVTEPAFQRALYELLDAGTLPPGATDLLDANQATAPLNDAGLAALRGLGQALSARVPATIPVYEQVIDEPYDPGASPRWRLHLARLDTPPIERHHIARAQPATGRAMERPHLAIEMTPDGSARLHALTRDHVMEPLGMLLGDEVLSAPIIRSPIPGGQVSVEMGSGSSAERLDQVQRLASDINLALPAASLRLIERAVKPLVACAAPSGWCPP